MMLSSRSAPLNTMLLTLLASFLQLVDATKPQSVGFAADPDSSDDNNNHSLLFWILFIAAVIIVIMVAVCILHCLCDCLSCICPCLRRRNK